MAHPNIPQFGDWKTAGNVPYTQCFENVRKGKKDKTIINPNDPQQNPEIFQGDNNTRPHRTPPRAQLHDDNNHPNQTPPRTPPNDYQPRGQFAPPTRRPQFAQEPKERQNPNAVPQKFDVKTEAKASPRHPKFQSSPGRDSPGGNNAGSRTPGKSPMGGAAGGRKAAIPEFGGWANNPTDPVGYTVIFTKAREDRKEEKQAPTPAIPPVPQRTPEHHSHNHGDTEKSSKSWFSSFLRKVKGVFTGR